MSTRQLLESAGKGWRAAFDLQTPSVMQAARGEMQDRTLEQLEQHLKDTNTHSR